MKTSVRKAGGKYTTTRAQYKAVKKYDHAQLDDFCSIIYAEGVKDGRASVKAVDAKDVIAAVGAVKGIGEKRMAQIGAAIDALFGAGPGGQTDEMR